MTSRSNSWRLATLALGAVLALAGCGSATDGDAKPTGSADNTSDPEMAADVPLGYDTCKDIPQNVLASEKLGGKSMADNSSGGIKWRGCTWTRPNGYSATISTTNLTVEMTRDKHFPEASEFAVAGRQAISTRQFNGPYIREACTVNVGIKGGSIDINLNNPASRRETGNINSCEIARALAEKIASTLPADV